MSLFRPVLPADVERIERERIAKKRPHLSLVRPDPRPDPDMFAWRSVADFIPVREG